MVNGSDPMNWTQTHTHTHSLDIGWHLLLTLLTCAIMHLKTGLDCHLASETITVSCRCTASSELSFLFGVHRDISNGIAPFKTKETRITDLLSLMIAKQ